MSSIPEIQGWCPTAFRPMESGDGLLIRPKIIGARIEATKLVAISNIAKTCGNGLIDLSQRAQLQIRGITPSTLDRALQSLDEAGLLAANEYVERIANILAPPLAGLDPSAIFDANRLVYELASALSQDAVFYTLPSKFLFAIQDGGKLPVDSSEADISIHPFEEDLLAVRLAGIEDGAVIMSPEKVIACVLRLTKAYIELRAAHPFEFRRIRKLIELTGFKNLIDKAGVSLRPFTPDAFRQNPTEIGVHHVGEIAYAGVAAPSGRWFADDLAELADLAVSRGLNEARLTPRRAILFPAAERLSALEIHSRAIAMGLVVEPSDPRRGIIACPGAPDCLQAQGETRKCLERLAPLVPQFAGRDGVSLHISGCSKGCARQTPAPVTLVLDDGRFNLVLDGGPRDKPTQIGLTLEEVERSLATNSRIEASCQAI